MNPIYIIKVKDIKNTKHYYPLCAYKKKGVSKNNINPNTHIPLYSVFSLDETSIEHYKSIVTDLNRVKIVSINDHKLWLVSNNCLEFGEKIDVSSQYTINNGNLLIFRCAQNFTGSFYNPSKDIFQLSLNQIKACCFDLSKNILQNLKNIKNLTQTCSYIASYNHKLNALFLGYLADKKIKEMTNEEMKFMKSVFTQEALNNIRGFLNNFRNKVHINDLCNLTEEFKAILRLRKEFFVTEESSHISGFIGFLELIRGKWIRVDLITKKFTIHDEKPLQNEVEERSNDKKFIDLLRNPYYLKVAIEIDVNNDVKKSYSLHLQEYEKAKIDKDQIYTNILNARQTRLGELICFKVSYILNDDQSQTTHRYILLNTLTGTKYELPMSYEPKVDSNGFIDEEIEALVPYVQDEDQVEKIYLNKDPNDLFYIRKYQPQNGELICSLHHRTPENEDCINLSYYNYSDIDLSFIRQGYYRQCKNFHKDGDHIFFRVYKNENSDPYIYIIKIKDIKNTKNLYSQGYYPLCRYTCVGDTRYTDAHTKLSSVFSLDKTNMEPYKFIVPDLNRISMVSTKTKEESDYRFLLISNSVLESREKINITPDNIIKQDNSLIFRCPLNFRGTFYKPTKEMTDLSLNEIKNRCFNPNEIILQLLKMAKKGLLTTKYFFSSDYRLNTLFLDYLADKKVKKMTDEEIEFMKSVFTQESLNNIQGSLNNPHNKVHINDLCNLTEEFKAILRLRKEFFVTQESSHISDFIGFLELIRGKWIRADLITKKFTIHDERPD